MTDFDEDDFAALEQRVRLVLFGGANAPSVPRLTEEERRIAERLLGSVNADKLARARSDRPVRVVPVHEVVLWWVVPSGDLRPDTWRIDRTINGKVEESLSGNDFDDLQSRLAEFRRRNIETRQFRRDQECQALASRPPRKPFGDRYGSLASLDLRRRLLSSKGTRA